MSKLLVRVDGSCIPNPGKMAIGIVIYKDGTLAKKVNEIMGKGTNNIAEYLAVIKGLEEVSNIPAEKIEKYPVAIQKLIWRALYYKCEIKTRNSMRPTTHKYYEKHAKYTEAFKQTQKLILKMCKKYNINGIIIN